MDVSALHSAQVSSAEVAAVVSSIFSDISLSAFEHSISLLYEPHLHMDAVAQTLIQVLQRLPTLANQSLQIEYAALCLKVADTRGISDPYFSQIQDLYCTILESHGHFQQVAKYLAEYIVPMSNNEDLLPILLRIGENYQKSMDTRLSFSYLTRMSAFIFRKTTPRDLIERFDTLRGILHLDQGNFLEAGRAFHTVSQGGVTAESRLAGLRRACIAAVLAPSSPNQLNLLKVCDQDDSVQNLDVYEMIDLITKGKFVDAIARDNFTEQVADLVPEDVVRRALSVSSTQHNLSVAQHILVSVKIPRLAELVGDTSENVEDQLGRMIDAGTMSAEIDQPAGIVIFTRLDPGAKDRVIAKFCAAVTDLVKGVRDAE
jgi:hypothetical protein